MRILYGVVGEGMGHATRSRVILEHLLAVGHEVRVVVSGRAHRFLTECFASRPGIEITEIHGLTLSYQGDALDISESILDNLRKGPVGLLKNLDAYARAAETNFKPQLIVSDFESWAYLYGRTHRLPVVSVDNQQVIHRVEHDLDVTKLRSFHFRLARAAVKLKLPRAYHFLVTSFFFPKVRKPRTTLVPPVLRPEILQARREPGEHVLVYQTASSNEDLVPTLRRLPYEFRVYGMGREGNERNVTLKGFSQSGFVEDLRTARALVAGGGFSLMCEAVHLHVPMLSIPVRKQYEQELNALYLEKLDYGAHAERLSEDGLTAFLERTEHFAKALSTYAPRDNAMLLGCVDELIEDVDLGEPPPIRLRSPSMGSYEGDVDEADYESD